MQSWLHSSQQEVASLRAAVASFMSPAAGQGMPVEPVHASPERSSSATAAPGGVGGRGMATPSPARGPAVGQLPEQA
eukprot:5078276-Lingulodinium_polyedra.AAC.1